MSDRSQQQLRARAAAESNRANRAASITTQPKRCGQDVASRPASATARPSVQRPRRTQSMKHPLQPASHSGAVLRRTRRVDGVEVDVHCRATASERCAPPRRRPLLSAAAATPLEAHAAALGVPERGDGVDASSGVRRSAARRGGRSPAPSSKFHQYLRENVRRSRNALEIQKETTHFHHSWRRVASMA